MKKLATLLLFLLGSSSWAVAEDKVVVVPLLGDDMKIEDDGYYTAIAQNGAVVHTALGSRSDKVCFLVRTQFNGNSSTCTNLQSVGCNIGINSGRWSLSAGSCPGVITACAATCINR